MITILITEYMRGYYDQLEYQCVVKKNGEIVYSDRLHSRRQAWKSAKRVVRQIREQ